MKGPLHLFRIKKKAYSLGVFTVIGGRLYVMIPGKGSGVNRSLFQQN
jgi:hypothetical protein